MSGLGDYVDGRSDPADRAAIEAHLALCEECSALLRDYREIPELVRRVTDQRMPREVEERLRELLARARTRS